MPRISHLVISVALGILGVLGIILLCTTSEDLQQPAGYKYGIVLDAGSSRTTLFVYKWPAGKENNTGIVSEHSHCHVKGAGISSYATNPPAAGSSLIACLDRTVETIPPERHAETPLYLGATAGMRLLNLTDPEATQGVLAAVSTTLKSYKFNFRGAKILSGNEEGVFGWVTANYLLENLVKYSWIGRWIKPVRNTVGAMDFGGASTQISFVPREKIEDPESEVFLRLYGHDYKVYTHSYLCYGRDQVMKKVLSQVMIAQGYSSSVTNPCMPKGYNVTYSQGFIYDSPCTASERPKNYSSQNPITFNGSSNPVECKHFVDTIFDFTHCAHNTCAFNGVYQPGVTGDFLAFAAFYYTMNFLKTSLNISITSLSELTDAADIICRLDFEKLTEKAPDVAIGRLVDYCTTSYYILTLVTRGYKFNRQSFKNIAFQKKAGDTTIGWALGYMLNLTNMIPAENPDLHKAQVVGAWGALIAIFILVIVAGVLVFVLSSRSVKNDIVL